MKKEAVLECIQKLYRENRQVIAGAKCPKTTAGTTIRDFLKLFHSQTGTYPGLLGVDVYNGNFDLLREDEKEMIASDLAAFSEAGGIVTLSSHFQNLHDMSLGWQGELGPEEKWVEAVTDGTTLNQAFRDRLDIPLDLLRRLNRRGVPVLWRPLHEMSAGWFWWGTWVKEGDTERLLPAKYYCGLFRYIYRYFTETCGLDNLLWVYSPTVNTPSLKTKEDVAYCYPGDDVVDIVGLDWYTNSLQEAWESGNESYQHLATLGKPMALTEFGPGDSRRKADPDKAFDCMTMESVLRTMREQGMPVAYFMCWSSYDDIRLGIHDMGQGRELMALPDILDLTKLSGMLVQ